MEKLPEEDKRALHALLVLARRQSGPPDSVGTCRLGSRVVNDASGKKQLFVCNLDGAKTNPWARDPIIPSVKSGGTVECCEGKCKYNKPESNVVVDLHHCVTRDRNVNDNFTEEVQLESGSLSSEPKFFPLAIDDYFMSVALLSKRFSKEQDAVGACIVSGESFHVFSIGYNTDTTCAPLHALQNSQNSCVDLTNCLLYMTCSPCLSCTKAIIKAGIRAVVYHEAEYRKKLSIGFEDAEYLEKEVHMEVYKAKACFKNYKCCIRIPTDKRFLIDVSACELEAKKLIPPPEKENKDKPQSEQARQQQNRPSYRDFFMAMAFLSHARSKDNKYQVGACLVTPAPHRLVAMGYNGMPDGHAFKDDKMDWGTKQSKYTCCAEGNAIIAAFRREADLSACTLYTTHSPCEDCCKLVVQAGIKNLVFAKYYHNGKAMYETLGRLPDMNIIRYEYMETGYGDIARIIMNIKKRTIELEHSRVLPQTEWECKKDNLCALCLTAERKTDKCVMSWSEVQEQPKKSNQKGKRDVDLPLDDYFMSLAILAECRSVLDEDRRVGACLVCHEPRRAISVGYSGHIDGLSDGKKCEKDYECCAEFNAIVSAFRYHADLTSATLYTTGFPCPRCASTIVQSGIKTVVYGGKMPKTEKAKDIFYWGKIATLEHRCQTEKHFIEIDLRGLVVNQTESEPTPHPLVKERSKL